MKRKTITLIVSLLTLVAVATTVGVSFALWENAPVEYTYTVSTESYINIDISDIIVDNGKLVPKSDKSVATKVNSTVNIDIKDYDCKLIFSAYKLQYKDGEEWHNLPDGILKIEFTNEEGSKIGDKTPPFKKDKRHVFKIVVSLEPHMDIIDPVYKNTNFKFSVTINASAVIPE